MRFTQFLRTFALGQMQAWGSALETSGAETPPLPSAPSGATARVQAPSLVPQDSRTRASLFHSGRCSHSGHFDQTGFYIGGEKKLPCFLFSQVPRWGTRAAQCSHLRLPSWTGSVKQERFQRRPIPTVDVRTGRPRLFQRQRELMTVSLLKTGQGGKLRIRSLMSRPGQDPKRQGFQT